MPPEVCRPIPLMAAPFAAVECLGGEIPADSGHRAGGSSCTKVQPAQEDSSHHHVGWALMSSWELAPGQA